MATSSKTYLTVVALPWEAPLWEQEKPKRLLLIRALFHQGSNSEANEDERKGLFRLRTVEHPVAWVPPFQVAGGVTASLDEANLLLSLTCWPFLNPFLLMDIFPPDFLWFFHLCTSFKGQSEYDCFRSERQNSVCFWEKRRRNAQGSLYKLAFLSLPCLLELRLNPGILAPLSSWPFIRRNHEFSVLLAVGTRSTVNLYQSQDEMLIIVLG